MLKKISLKDKETFNSFLSLARHELSVYAFENIYIWKGLFDIYWCLIDGSLCVFFQDTIGTFLYLPPLGKKISHKAVEGAFQVMDGFNKNKEISRIENLEEQDLKSYQELGFKPIPKSVDYVCSQKELADLKGAKFKSKRACYNCFTKHSEFEYLPFSKKDGPACLKLYALWARQRKTKSKDKIYQGMISDSQTCLKILLEDYPRLNITGRVVKAGSRFCAFTFGFPVNPDTFCVLYEITDLSVNGLAQFIFREFCREMKDYKYINIMDDSGLENLKAVKLSYHPVKLVPAYIVNKNGY